MDRSDRELTPPRGTGTINTQAPDRKGIQKAKSELIATLNSIRAGNIPIERLPVILANVALIVDSFVLDHTEETKK